MGFLAQSRLTTRILLWVVVAAGLVFFVVTVVTVLHGRDQMYQAAKKDATRSVSRNLAAISEALWDYDTAALNATLGGLVQSGSIIRAEVHDLNRQVSESERADNQTKPDTQWEIPILGPDRSKQIGVLKISESYSELRDVVARNLAIELLAELAKIVGLAALLFIIVYRLVTRHLQSLARDVSSLVPNDAPTPITLNRKDRHDELDTLVASINRFRNERAEVENALLRDIAERKQVEATLHKAESDLSEALQIAQLAHWQYNAVTQEFTLNDRYYLLLRTSANEVGGYHLRADDFFDRLLSAEDRSAFLTFLKEAAQGLPSELYQTETHTLCADGEARLMLVRCKVELSDERKAVRLKGTVQDVTERRREQEALRATQSELARVTHLSTIGQMTASISHEVNQPLAAIVANANAGLRFLRAERPDLCEVGEALTRIVDEGHRAGQVVQSIRSMFKKDSQLRSQVDVNQIIQEVFALVRDDLQGQRIQVQTQLSKKIPKVSGVHIQLQQVIFNLFTNAIEAMASTRGRAHVLRVSSEHREADDVLITVEDSGSGIDPKNADHIFNPFFTTKSHGMGMGLSICRSIVEAHQGRLFMSPAANGGTMFKITLPADEHIS